MKRIISLCLIILIVLSTACVGSAASDKETVSILPPLEEAFGVGLPSFDNMYLQKLTGTETLNDGRTQFFFEGITAEDYQHIGRGFAACACTLQNYSVDGNLIKAEITKENTVVHLEYDLETRKLSLVYPKYYYTNAQLMIDETETACILPDLQSAFGVLLPRVSNVLMRDADRQEQLPDGGYSETYEHFTEENYNAFSQYLNGQNCSVLNYYTEGKVLTINLGKDGAAFTILYDPDAHTITMQYPANARPEPGPIYTPTPQPTVTPTPKPTATPTPKPTATPTRKPTVKPTAIPTIKPNIGRTTGTNSGTKTSGRGLSREECIEVAKFYFQLHVGLPSNITFTDVSMDDNQALVMLIYTNGYSTQGIGILLDRISGDVLGTQRFAP